MSTDARTLFSLKGKTAFVTGGGSGIGEAIAHVLSSAGAFTYVADRDAEHGNKVARAILDRGDRAAFLELDVTQEECCAAAAAEVSRASGPLDILVNNAGIGHVGTVEQTTGADMDRLYATNVRGMFNVTRAFVGDMLRRQSGSIVNIASIGGILAIRDRLAYCTTKFAVVGFTKCLALDHAKQGLRVNCVCPGRVETPFVTSRLKEYPDPQAAYRQMSDTQAIGRMGKPDEIAAAVLYLASDESAFVTGSALIIDGGWSAGK